MKICTIEDFRQASEREVHAYKKEISVRADLQKYLAFLNSPHGYRIRSSFEVGYNGRDRGRGLHASALSDKGTCPLKHWFDVTGEVEEDQTVRMTTQLTFDLGTAIHSLFQAYFLDMYEYQDNGQTKNYFTPEISLSCAKLLITNTTTDGEFRYPRFRMVLEIKSMNDSAEYGFPAVVRRPLPSHVRQLMIYMYISDCPFGLLFYFGKNNSEIVEHVVLWDEALWAEIEEEAQHVIAAVQANKAPEPKTSSLCRDCRYLNGCAPGKDFVFDASKQKTKLGFAAAVARQRRLHVRRG